MKKEKLINIKSKILIGITAILIFIISCNKDNTGTLPSLTTSIIINITETSAIGGGNIISDGGTPIKDRGVCWSTEQTPTINDNKTSDGAGIDSFVSTLTNLNNNTTYYVRAYASNSHFTNYGKTISFTTGGVTDIDGNVYRIVNIGNQIWMAENLKTTHYRDGTPIPYITDSIVWSNLRTDAYCHHNNNLNDSSIYGILYNFHAAISIHNICPEGWHLPTNEEWNALIKYLGGNGVAGGKMKEAGFAHWLIPNTNATNLSGFNGLPTGLRNPNGSFSCRGTVASWWSATINDNYTGYDFELSHNFALINNYLCFDRFGYTIRCIKD